MKHLKGLFEEIKIELDKAYECEYYSGIIFVHPDDVESVVRFIYNLYSVEWNSKRKIFTFDNGSVLLIDTLERDVPDRYPQHDYAGYEFTTILIHQDCFSKYNGEKYIPVNKNTFGNGGEQTFIMYMLSRKRSESKFSSRMVIL